MNRVKRATKDAQPPEAIRPRNKAKGHSNDNKPFDDKAWRRKYMRLYMQKRRQRERAAKAKEQAS